MSGVLATKRQRTRSCRRSFGASCAQLTLFAGTAAQCMSYAQRVIAVPHKTPCAAASVRGLHE